jgi:hypothetical protein
MSPKQLKKLQHLRDVFESGRASNQEISELSELLTLINQSNDDDLFQETDLASQP